MGDLRERMEKLNDLLAENRKSYEAIIGEIEFLSDNAFVPLAKIDHLIWKANT